MKAIIYVTKDKHSKERKNWSHPQWENYYTCVSNVDGWERRERDLRLLLLRDSDRTSSCCYVLLPTVKYKTGK